MKQRTERLGMDIQAALGDLLIRGEVKDPRVRNTPLITITRVRVTGDLREAHVGFTVFGADEPSLERVCDGLTAARSHLQHELARRLRTRSTPLLTFEIDRSLEQAFEMNRLLREVNAGGLPQPVEASAGGEPDAESPGAGADEDAEGGGDDGERARPETRAGAGTGGSRTNS